MESSGSIPVKRRLLRPKFLVPVAVIVFIVIGVAVVAFDHTGSKIALTGDTSTFVVEKKPLTISVTESGTIQAREQIILKCEVEGKTTILTLVEEGTRVKKGDLLVELDASELLDAKVDQQIRVQNAEASFVGARENLAVVENQAKSDVDQAKLTLDFSKQDLKKYVEGEYQNQRKEMESEITLAKEELQTAEEKLNWSKKLFEKQYISQTELQIDELSAHKNKLNVELAENNLRLLEEFTHPRNLAKLESDVNQAEMALERTNRKAKANVVQAEAELKAKESEFDRQKDKLKKNEEQIAKTKIYAPADGQVIYATSAKTQGWRSQEPLIEGREVYEQEELIYLPTAAAVKAVVKVHETSLQKVKADLPVKVTVDALPGKTFTGHVEKIAPLPDAQMMWMNPDLKVYNTEVYLDGEGGGLRTGMSCKAEIIIEKYEDVIQIPVQAVLRIGGEPTVYVQKGGGFEPRKVKIGMDNNSRVRIIEGLQVGEAVLLTPPLASASVEQQPADANVGKTPSDESAGVQKAQPSSGAEGVEKPETDKVKQEGPKAEGGPSPEQMEKMRKKFENMSDEEKAKMRERFENMSDEEKAKMRQQREGRRQKQAGEGE